MLACSTNILVLYCTPAGARTLDTLIKSQVLYQLSYGCIVFCFASAKVLTLFETSKIFSVFFQKNLQVRQNVRKFAK